MTRLTVLPHPDLCPEGAEVEVAPGARLSDALLTAGVAIEHACEKVCACATCHVHVGAPWLAKLPPMADFEKSMLEFAADNDASSRLGCQIKMTAELDGIVVHTPLGQH